MRRTSPRLRVPLLAALFGAGALALAPAIAGAQCQTNSSCYPPNACILASSPAMQYAGTPDVIRNVSLLSPTHCVAPPAPGLTADSFFDVFVELDLSTNNGGTFQSTSGGAHCTVHMLGTGGSPPTYQTEMLQMDLSGLPGGVMIRESPTLASSGQTTITDLGGGQFKIDSFFDVFTELSLDGGQSWHPSNGSMHVTENPYSPTTVPHATWGAIKILYR